MGQLRLIWLLLPLTLAGCAGNVANSAIDPGQLDVFGVSLDAATDYREIRGIRGSDDPCLKGYDRSFDELNIVIGYGREGRIRKITTRNPQNSMFGVHPGEAAATAATKFRAAGFVESGAPFRFRKEDLVLTLLVDGTGKLFGMTLETDTPLDYCPR